LGVTPSFFKFSEGTGGGAMLTETKSGKRTA
jgi:hypothetical protein